MANCEAIINVRGGEISIPISEENRNNLENIITDLFNSDQLGELIDLLDKSGYVPRVFNLSNNTLGTEVGNSSLFKLITKYLNPNLNNQDIFDESHFMDNILLVNNLSGTGLDMQIGQDGELKFVIDDSILRNSETRNSKLIQVMKMSIAYKALLKQDQRYSELIKAVQNIFDDLLEKADKYTSNTRLKIIMNRLSEIEDSGRRLSELLVYIFGDIYYKSNVDKDQLQILEDVIRDTITPIQSQALLNPDSSDPSEKYLSRIIKGDIISKEELEKIIKEDSLEGDPLEILQQWIYDFNTKLSYNNLFIRIQYEATDHYKLKTLFFDPVKNPNIHLLSPNFYGSSTRLIEYNFGFNIVEHLGQYYVGQSLMFSTEKLSERLRRFDNLREARAFITKERRKIRNSDKTYSGARTTIYNFKNKILVSGFKKLQVDIKNSKLTPGSMIPIKHYPKVKFIHDISILSSRWKPAKLPTNLFWQDMTVDVDQFLNSFGYFDFFKDSAQKQKYLERMQEISDLEFFLMRATDLLQDKIDSGEILELSTIFSVDPTTRYKIIDQVLDEMEVSEFKILKVENVKQGKKKNLSTVTFSEVKEAHPSQLITIPRFNIKRDLLAVVNHLKDHFGVNCTIINDDDIKNGMEINGKKVRFPDSVKRARAFIFNGQIYVNIERGDAGDVIHEYMHLALGILKVRDPKTYYSLTSLVTQLPDYQDQIKRFRKFRDYRSELDLQEELFVTLLGKEFGQQIVINFYNNENIEKTLNRFKKEFRNIIIKAFALGQGAENLELEQILTKDLQQIIENFGSMIFEKEPVDANELIEATESRQVTNLIARMIRNSQFKEHSESYIEEICE